MANSQINNIAQLLTVIVLFIFVLGLTYFATRVMGNYQKVSMRSPNMELLESMRVAGNKCIQLVRVGEKYFVIAVCRDTITYIGEVDKNELALNKSEGLPAFDFKTLLDKAKRQNNDKENS